MGDFESYLDNLKERLGLGPAEAQEIIEEFESHLHDKAVDLEAEGLDGDTARDLAIQHLGDPSDISRRMRLVYGYGDWQDILLAASPHFMIASLFFFEICCNYLIITALLGIIVVVTWTNWRHGNPSKWSYSWLGYAVAAPAISLMVCLQSVGYGAWALLAGEGVPVFDPMVILLIGCAPFAIYQVIKLAHQMVKNDWLWLTFATLPLPVVGSWVLIFHSNELYMGVHLEMLGQMDYTQIGVFVALGLISALYLKLGKRGLKLSLLLVSAVVFGTITSATMPVGLHFSNVAMMFSAYLALFAAPVLWRSFIDRQDRQQVIQGAVG